MLKLIIRFTYYVLVLKEPIPNRQNGCWSKLSKIKKNWSLITGFRVLKFRPTNKSVLKNNMILLFTPLSFVLISFIITVITAENRGNEYSIEGNNINYREDIGRVNNKIGEQALSNFKSMPLLPKLQWCSLS